MSERSKQWMCKFIVLFIFMTGVCFEEVQADPVLVCTMITDVVEQQQDFDQESTSVYFEKETEGIETIAARSITNTQQLIDPVANGRRSLKLFIALVYVTVLGLLLSNSYAMAYVTQFPERVSKTIVVNYIHNTDGKKRV